ncbi:hypothetical protein D9611_001745 [Ephemerocybe angulata]|uniref:Glycosyltransferase 2-like domain-containing protein n=1 Tax=Ephemerocybe angulata TaxID=980116 RepID=A0A8H5CI72_9AGAR|nr:hypothetical protein D9611_001745 [Tulosesus angulatus]
MATPHSFESLAFRLTDAPFGSSVTCSLTIENTANTLPKHTSDEEPPFRFTFAVDFDDATLDERKAAEWLNAHLQSCSVVPVNADDTQQLDPKSLDKIKLTVKNMAGLWAKAQAKNQLTMTVPSASSSSTTLNDMGTPQIRHRELRLSEVSFDKGSPRNFSLPLRSSVPGTPSREETDSKRRTLFDDLFIEQLSNVKWKQEHEQEAAATPEPKQNEPLFILPPNPRNPAAPLTPDITPPATPVVQETPIHRVVVTEEKAPVEEEPTSKWYHFWHTHGRLSNMKPTIAVLADESVVVLPSPPTDSEKYLYGQTRRLPLYLFGTFSFLSVSVGMWFFVIASKYYMWLGVFVAFIQAYLSISYFVGFCGKDFDIPGHKKIVEEYAVKDNEPCPSVDVYLPCCKEPIEILENTYKYVAKIDYPNLKVWVLDDGGMDSVKRLATAYGFNYICRDNRPELKKAGNLRYAFTRTEGDFFLIFDADFCPRADILKDMIPRMRHDPNIAIVQTPQFFRPCAEQTWCEQGASATQEFFYRIVQVNRDRFGAAICVGSNALYRREALVDVGGTAEIGHSEDVHTGFYAITRGWTLKYMPLALACGVSPDTPAACFSQQMRWCAGSSYLLTNPDFWASKLTWVQKLCFMSGMLFYSSAAFMILVSNLPGPLLVWLNPQLVLWYNCFFAVPSLIYATIIFRMWSRVNYNFNVNYVFTLQQYAYFMAIKDRILGTTAAWVPSGDNKAHVKPGEKKKKPNNKHRNMRILCFVWVWGTGATMFAGIGYRIYQGFHWFHFLPLIIFDLFQLFQSHKFIFYSK